MRPILFTIPLPWTHLSWPIYAYGVMAFCGFVAGMIFCARRAKRYGFDPEVVMDITLISVIGGIAGARALYVLQSIWEGGAFRFWETFKIWHGGLVFYGGLIVAIAANAVYLRWRRVSFWKAADLVIPGVVIGVSFGRIGCFLNGCCYGKPVGGGGWRGWLGMTFPVGSLAHQEQVARGLVGWRDPALPVWPTQLMSWFCLVVIAAILARYYKRRRFDGEVMLLAGILYPAARFLIEFLRGDNRGLFPDLARIDRFIGHPAAHFLATLHLSQWISLLVLALCAGLYFLRRRRGREAASAPAAPTDAGG